MLADPPSCVYHHQSNIAWGWMPDGLTFGPDGDVDFFVLPGGTADEDPPLLVGLDLAIAFDDRPAVEALMAHLATPESTSIWAAAGGFTSPRRTGTDVELQPADQAAVDLLLDANSLNVDASDAMPPEVGTTLFWNQITRWVSGGITYGSMAVIMDDARPSDS
jgi:alpha-glucoside transport system substrate-binding protein